MVRGPLPGSEKVVFLTSDIEKNRAAAVRIMHLQQETINQLEMESVA